MAASNANTGFGADLLKGNADGPPETFTTFGVEITNINLPSMSRSTHDVTHHKSPDATREFTGGLIDSGEFTVDVNYIPSAGDIMVAALYADKQNWQISLPGGVTCTGTAIVTAFDAQTPLDGQMTASVTFKTSGKWVFA